MKKALPLLALCIFFLPSLSLANDMDLTDFVSQCEAGNMAACSVLGDSYYTASGVSKDLKKAGEFWKKACDLKEVNSCYNLGVLYLSLIHI